jgi:hypothetical protein
LIDKKIKNKPDFLMLLNSVFEALLTKTEVFGCFIVEDIDGRLLSILLY